MQLRLPGPSPATPARVLEGRSAGSTSTPEPPPPPPPQTASNIGIKHRPVLADFDSDFVCIATPADSGQSQE